MSIRLLRDFIERRSAAGYSGFLGRIVIVACVGWVAGLLLISVWIHRWAESNLVSAFLIYLPPVVLLLPIVGLLPLAAVSSQRRALLVMLVSATGLFVWLYAGYEFGVGTPVVANSQPNTLKVLTYNSGQSHKTSLKPFIVATNPDIIVLQDVRRTRVATFQKDPFYGQWPTVVQEGEHLLLSRYPVTLHQSLLSEGADPKTGQNWQLGARFTVQLPMGDVQIYSVHLPTCRDVLSWYARRGAFLYGLIGLPGTPWAERRRQYDAYWHERVGYARTIAADAATVAGPKLLLGDLNTPPHGQGYRLLRAVFPHDAHADAGSGFGYTFPGDTGRIGSLFSPWLRLDVAMADRHWTVNGCTTEAGRCSQHLAVCASFRLIDGARM